MNYIYKGMAAGFTGAVVTSAFLLLNAETGFLPGLDFVAMIGRLTGTGIVGGWILHLLIGATLGGLFAWLDPDLPGDSLRQRGMIMASGAWLLMMFFLMPLGGAGFFALNNGVLTPVAAFVIHLIFGWVMGRTYGWLILQTIPVRYRQSRRS